MCYNKLDKLLISSYRVILFCILAGNWEKLESGLRALVIEKNLDVEVYTGDDIHYVNIP